ncbi:carboxypeptidase-like regulatory domain-containing protein [Pedobacter faecalis]|uniref:carboxypeptidase-like regulatory domain-containing protein n=1 Tax=Pedobacter faecalis TaxID=3041495 RepID=UPI00254FDEF9|nr:carboxypeptidase-like regulatory domain-containing protein [Pedobacter sp. ELA7]
MIRFILTLLLLSSAIFTGMAQQTFTISGFVKNSKGEPIEAATVFIDGSQSITRSGKDGGFAFKNLFPGTYQVVVNMMGYQPVKQSTNIQTISPVLDIRMADKAIILKEVVIGNNAAREKFMKIFIKNFIGESGNAKQCKLVNPQIIDFSTNKKIIEGVTDDFLIIDNQSLGYRIKYLLRHFRFNQATGTTSYDGQCIFEELEGSEAQKAVWQENRKLAYEGSLMHYFRAFYNNQLREEGFLTYSIKNGVNPMQIDPRPVLLDQIAYRADSTFVTIELPSRMYTVFDRKKAASADRNMDKESLEQYMEKTGSIMKPYLKQAKIDAKGSYVDYRSFLISGFWGRKRIGDQLPYEYQPE